MRSLFLLTLAFVLAVPASAQSPHTIDFRSRSWTPSPEQSLRAAPAADGDEAYVLLQFEDRLPAPEALAARGIEPVQFVNPHTIVARVPAGTQKASLSGVRWMGTFAPEDKVSAGVGTQVVGMVSVVVEAYPQTSAEALGEWIRQSGGTVIPNASLPDHVAVVDIPAWAVEGIAGQNGVSAVYKAADHLLKGDPTYYCPGAMTAYGPVAPFNTNGEGWDGPGQGSAALTYFWGNSTPDLSVPVQRSEVLAGLAEWSEVAAITFTESATANVNAQFDILWASGDHGDGSSFDGSGGVLAHAFFPAPPNPETIAGDMHFDEAETWITGTSGGFNLFIVAAHEAGHSLGLLHSDDGSALMAPFYNPALDGVQADDIAGIQSLYAALSATDPEFAYSPGSVSVEVPTDGMTTETITIENTAEAGSDNLTWTATEVVTSSFVPSGESVTASGRSATPRLQAGAAVPAQSLGSTDRLGTSARTAPQSGSAARMPVDCTDGQTLDQLSATSAGGMVTGGQELGQSFTAPCSGVLTTVAPVINRDVGGNQATVWEATLRVYDGASTALGDQIASFPFFFNNADGPGSAFFLPIPVGPVEIVEGQVYTWFVDMTLNDTGAQFTNGGTGDVYTGGDLYFTGDGNPASASPQGSLDFQFQATFGAPAAPPDVPWLSLAPASGTVAPGGSDALVASFDATGLADGTYTAEILIETNDPLNPSATMPVTMIVGGTAPGTGVVNGSPGWYLMGSPTDNTTVDQLATQNLVAGVPGFYPTFSEDTAGANPTLFTGYDGSSWTASGGTGEVIESGQGFLWYFWDATFTPTEATTNASSAVPFPVTLTAPGAVNTASVNRTLHADGNRINAMGNPFGTTLDLTDIANWPGGKKVASKGRAFVWDTDLNTWVFGAAAADIDTWQGFAVRAKQSADGATLTIPASAASPLTGDTTAKAPEADDRRVLALTLEGTEASTSRRIEDRLLEVVFEDDGAIGWDENDAEKLAPLAESYLMLGVEAARDGRGVLKAAESLPFEPVSVSLPLALETAGAAPTLTLRWPTLETLPADWAVTLHDLATGESVDLRSEEAYTFRSAVAPRKVFTSAPELKDADASGAATRFVLTVETGVAPVAYAETFEFGMADIAPNPTRDQARVSFTLADAAETTVAVYDVQGREVARLTEGRREAGRHEVRWATGSVAPGVYVVRLASGERVETRRAVVIR